MRENFFICVEAVLPMFMLLAMGYGIRRMGVVDDKQLNKMNSLTFKFLFPFLMFNNVYGSDITDVVSLKLIVFTVVAIGIEYAIAAAIVLRIEPSNRSRGAMIQAIYRSNFVIMGLPIAINIYGHGNVGLTAVMVAIVVPVYNVMAVVTLETFRDGHVDPVAIAKRVARNPLILGAVTGIVFVLLGIRLPEIVGGTVEQLAACATPIALLILRASFKFSYAKAHVGNLTLCVVSRLFVVPAVALSLAAFLGFRGIAFVTLIAIFAAPCAISSFTMAQEMDSDGDLAGSTVVFTSALCCLTMFGWLFLFKNLGMF